MPLTISEFKNQIKRSFGVKMKESGFAGSGFRYWMEIDKFLFIVEIIGNEFRQFNVHFGIQPKAITQLGDFDTHDFKKISSIDCELSRMLINSINKPVWNIEGSEGKNHQSGEEMFRLIQKQVLPVVKKYINNPDLFDEIKPSDISNEKILTSKLCGVTPAGLPTRTAWMFAIYYESLNKKRAKQFALFGLENNGKPTVKITKHIKKMLDEGLISGSAFGDDPYDESFFGMDDLKKIAAFK